MIQDIIEVKKYMDKKYTIEELNDIKIEFYKNIDESIFSVTHERNFGIFYSCDTIPDQYSNPGYSSSTIPYNIKQNDVIFNYNPQEIESYSIDVIKKLIDYINTINFIAQEPFNCILERVKKIRPGTIAVDIKALNLL